MKSIGRAAAIVIAGLTFACGHGADRREAADEGRYGSLVPPGYLYHESEIRLAPDTKFVAVRRLDIVRFVNAQGSDFVWRFDTIREGDVFPFERIAPQGFSVPPGITVYVNPEIPVAP